MEKQFNEVIHSRQGVPVWKKIFLQLTLLACLGVFSTSYAITDPDLTFQQQVKGTVTDDSGVPLPGASIVVRGTTTGTVADFDGNYTINVASNGVLVFSYVGFTAKEIAVNGNTTINVSLEIDSSLLDEVVVVGYGTQKKGEVTAAIASVDAEQLGIVQTSSSIDAVKGQISGVDIQASGGRPGQTSTVRIRGRRSITASNDPLYVVDGIPLIDGSILTHRTFLQCKY